MRDRAPEYMHFSEVRVPQYAFALKRFLKLQWQDIDGMPYFNI